MTKISDKFITADEVRKIVREETGPRFDAIDDKFDAIDDKFDAIDDKFDAIDDKFDAIDDKFKTIEKKIDDVLNFMNTIMKRFGDWEEERELYRGQRDMIEDLDIRLTKVEKIQKMSFAS